MAVVEQIVARGFRNLHSEPWRPDVGRQLILGPNGAGKTSWLEAIYALATTRSFRTHRLSVCTRHGGSQFYLCGEVSGARRSRLELSWDRSTSGSRRSLNGSQVSTAEYLSVLPVVTWSAASAEVVSGAPADRRRFLDQGLVAGRPTLFETLSRYRQALGQKRALLREGRSSELETWNGVLAPLIAEIVRERARHAEELDATVRDLMTTVGRSDLEIRLRYRPSLGFEREMSPSESLAKLEEVRQQEIETRRPAIGPQRDELEIFWGDHPAALVTSAGERKLLGLALHVARGRLLTAAGRSPIYLLDDLDTELDEGRLEVVSELFPTASQLFVTSNRPHVWRRISIDRIWSLESAGAPIGIDSLREL